MHFVPLRGSGRPPCEQVRMLQVSFLPCPGWVPNVLGNWIVDRNNDLQQAGGRWRWMPHVRVGFQVDRRHRSHDGDRSSDRAERVLWCGLRGSRARPRTQAQKKRFFKRSRRCVRFSHWQETSSRRVPRGLGSRYGLRGIRARPRTRWLAHVAGYGHFMGASISERSFSFVRAAQHRNLDPTISESGIHWKSPMHFFTLYSTCHS